MATQADRIADLARDFGTLPEVWGLRLSPNGQRVVLLHQDAKFDAPIALVGTLNGATTPILASETDRFDLWWCQWASNERLLCGFGGVTRIRGQPFYTTRLVAVDPDGGNRKVLLQDRLARQNVIGQFQDDVVDWLPDDPAHVLIELPENDATGLARLDIRSGRLKTIQRPRSNIREWLSDGHGNAHVRQYVSERLIRWEFRNEQANRWEPLFQQEMTDLDAFYQPIGFSADPQRILLYCRQGGLVALCSQALQPGAQPELLVAAPGVDISDVIKFGKYRRLVAAIYHEDRPRRLYFDDRVRVVNEQVGRAIGSGAQAFDESWDQQAYLVYHETATSPGRYYHLDLAGRRLTELWPRYPQLADRELVPMQPWRFTAADGTEIPAYLHRPAGEVPLPLVVLPHGGPESRDTWGFDWLPQFLAANGYLVLQVNFRGSGGYGEDWAGPGGFQAWRRTVGDVADGVRALIDAGDADPQRVCIIGWSYGGYAALMSAISEPELYRCVVSIAGVTDPTMLINEYRNFLNRRAVREFIGTSDEVRDRGSPLKRATEIRQPLLLFHGDEDLNVRVGHSKALARAVKKAGGDVSLQVYDDAEHNLWSNRYRVDMLERIGRFLAEYNGPAAD
ncbi:MAG: S9 family peptidase [Gammaproteobacteria bacterium]|nr:MAG: S9 family peptidase [Gammaproteobacteria bacterium]